MECDVRRENELIAGAENLARIHLCMRLAGKKTDLQGRKENPVIKEYARHNRELRKVREFVCRRSVKSPFEIAFLKGYDQMYFWADRVLKILENMDLDSVFKEAEAENHMVHGDYNYHNLLVCQEGMAVTGFEHAHRDVQMEDLYYFLRKCMEKHHYDERLGYRMMRAYDSVNNLGKKNGITLQSVLLIRKNSGRSPIRITTQERHGFLQKCRKTFTFCRTDRRKKRFLRNLFAFQI